MSRILKDSLYEKQHKKFLDLADLTRHFTVAYCGTTIIRDTIFAVILNYARREGIEVEILRFPIKDEELWAFTFIKQGRIFVCINSELSMCKQFFAAAHELYHIYCYTKNEDAGMLQKGSLLDSEAGDSGKTQEDLEANAFAAMLLMPDELLQQQLFLFGIDKRQISVDDILALADIFAVPYKAAILRLYEGGHISTGQAEALLSVPSDVIEQRILLTGRAKRWQLNGHGTETFGSLMENMNYNAEHGLLTDSREQTDRAFITELKKQYKID